MSSGPDKPTSHTISVLVENRPGVLTRIAGLFARRGYNIESLAVGPTEEPQYSRMTIVVRLTKPVEQVIRQVQKLVSVFEVRELQFENRIARELLLIKVRCRSEERPRLEEALRDIQARVKDSPSYQARVVDASEDTAIVEAAGTYNSLDALAEELVPFGILELCRTGRIALERGAKTLSSYIPSI